MELTRIKSFHPDQMGPLFLGGNFPGPKLKGSIEPDRQYVACFNESYRANSTSRRQSAGSRRSLRLVTQSNSPCCRGGCMYHADIGRGARPNSSAREAMSTSDTDLGSRTTTARPAVACTFIEFGAISPRQ